MESEPANTSGAAVGPTAFSSDAEHWLHRDAEMDINNIKKTREDWEAAYEIERCVGAIVEHGFERVALQFPDHLLGDSVCVAAALRERTGARVFILGDTTYGRCVWMAGCGCGVGWCESSSLPLTKTY